MFRCVSLRFLLGERFWMGIWHRLTLTLLGSLIEKLSYEQIERLVLYNDS